MNATKTTTVRAARTSRREKKYGTLQYNKSTIHHIYLELQFDNTQYSPVHYKYTGYNIQAVQYIIKSTVHYTVCTPW